MATAPVITGAPTRAPASASSMSHRVPIEILRALPPGPMAKRFRELLAAQGEPHPDDVPEVYASTCVGRCLEPLYADGSCIVFSRVEVPEPGDCVGIWLHPTELHDGRSLRAVKRLVSSGWPGIAFPFEIGGSEVVPIVSLEMLNPPRRFAVPATRVMAMHKVIGTAVPDANGMAAFRRGPA